MIGSEYRPETRFSDLGDAFSSSVEPASFPQAQERFWNKRWAAATGLSYDLNQRRDHFHTFMPLPDNQSSLRAIKYHGHQFRVYNSEIGDGRGFLLAQLRDQHNRVLDLGTKGSGQTPFSRSGDGRLTLKGAVREILAAQTLEALGVYTSKILSVFETGEALYRGDEPSPTRSAVMTRLQHSHIRFGVFQRHAYFERADLIEVLVNYSLDHLLPDARGRHDDAGVALLTATLENSARLTAQWMAAGFVHGVLNTDNLVLTGESFDYGPWRFLPVFEPGFTAAYFDESGLYAYARQPEAVFWALQQLAGALSLVSDKNSLIAVLQTYPNIYKQEIHKAFLHRLGLESLGADKDENLIKALLDFMKVSQISYEAVFFDWFCGEASLTRAEQGPRCERYKHDDFQDVRRDILSRSPIRPERLNHDYFKRDDPVHMTLEFMESIWAPIAQADDWTHFTACLDDIDQARTGYDLGFERIGFLAG